MVIKIKPRFTDAQIKALLKGKLEIIINAYIQRLRYIGEEFVKNARESGSYTDRTGNLRNSIGYVILRDGEQIEVNFKRSVSPQQPDAAKGDDAQKVPDKTDENGVDTGLAKAMEIAEKFPKGLALICVAGMNYAAAVESLGFDVISSSSIIARDHLVKAIESIYKKVQKL
jgi:hypothetical protein